MSLFIDENRLNLLEVQHVLPEINTVDAATPECDALLEQIIFDNQQIDKSRVEEYRLIDRKIQDRKVDGTSQDEFLLSCYIRVCLVSRMDNLDFADRIEEVINRTNQLNFTKSRIESNAALDMIANIMR